MNILFLSLMIAGLSQSQLVIGSSCCGENQIEVSGEGLARGQPDIVILRIGFN